MFGFGFDRMTDKLIKRPSEILGANYYDHWDYTDPTTLSVTGTDINSCTSKGLNGAVMASTGTERFKVLTNQINGYQVADLDGINDFAQVAASTGMYNFLHNSGTGCIITVYKKTTSGVAEQIIGNATSASQIGIRQTNGATDTHVSITGNGGGTPIVSNNTMVATLTTQFNLIIDSLDTSNATASLRSTINQNGTNYNNNANLGTPSASNATNNMIIGKRPDNAQYFSGLLVEVLIANIKPTSQQITDLINYYTFKYGTFPIL